MVSARQLLKNMKADRKPDMQNVKARERFLANNAPPRTPQAEATEKPVELTEEPVPAADLLTQNILEATHVAQRANNYQCKGAWVMPHRDDEILVIAKYKPEPAVEVDHETES